MVDTQPITAMVKNLVLIGLAGILGTELFWLGGEVWARRKFGTVCSQPHPVWHHQLIPNRECTKKLPEFSVDYKINSLGLRDDQIRPEKTGSRILMLGDSFTEGAGVKQTETFSALLEQDLGVEVVNAGVSGYSPILEYLWLKDEGLKLKPDLVIINVNESDFSEEQKYHSAKMVNEAGEIVAIPGKPLEYLPKFLARWLQRQSTFYGIFNTQVVAKLLRLKAKLQGIETKPGTSGGIFAWSKGVDVTESDRLWSLMEQDITLIDRLLDEQKIPHLIVLQPFGHHVFEEAWPGRTKHNLEMGEVYAPDYFGRLMQLGDNVGMEVIDLRGAFKDDGNPEIFYPDDGHWTADGHKLVAEILKERLQ